MEAEIPQSSTTGERRRRRQTCDQDTLEERLELIDDRLAIISADQIRLRRDVDDLQSHQDERFDTLENMVRAIIMARVCPPATPPQ